MSTVCSSSYATAPARRRRFTHLLGAQQVREDESDLLQARRSVVRAGISEFELPELRPLPPDLTTIEREMGWA